MDTYIHCDAPVDPIVLQVALPKALVGGALHIRLSACLSPLQLERLDGKLSRAVLWGEAGSNACLPTRQDTVGERRLKSHQLSGNFSLSCLCALFSLNPSAISFHPSLSGRKPGSTNGSELLTSLPSSI